jgi:hypothetical protein
MVQELRLGSRIPRGLRLILWHRGPCVLIEFFFFFFQLVHIVVVFYGCLDIRMLRDRAIAVIEVKPSLYNSSHRHAPTTPDTFSFSSSSSAIE